MRKVSLLSSIIIMVAAVSCKSGSGETKKVTAPIVTPTLNTPVNPVTPTSVPVNPAPIVTPTTNTPTTNTPATTVPAVTAKGMNPPHGQPGHRCDIAVGAPLDSKPNQAPATNTSTTPQTISINPSTSSASTTPVVNTQSTQPSTATVTAPGMNPPHGQPGHRCDISVGAPLNSKPTPTVSTVPAGPQKQ